MKMRFLFTALLSFFISLTFAAIVPSNDNLKITEGQQSQFLHDLFKNLDKVKLKSKDETEVIKYITEKNIEIKNYLVSTYPKEEFEALNVNDPGTLIIGLMTAVAEVNNFQPIEKIVVTNSGPSANFSSDTFLPQWAACAMEVITGAFDVVGLYNSYVTLFTGSATWTSVAGIVGRTLLRQFGWFAAAYMVYDIVNTCL